MTHAPFRGIPQSDYRLFHLEKERGAVILGLRTDKPEAELYLYEVNVKGRTFHKLDELKWQAHRELAETIHKQIKKILNPGTKISKLRNPITDYSARDLVQGKQVHSLSDIDGIVVFKGPGSFTGLRIGLSVANALAYALEIPIVAKKGKNWLKAGIKDLLAGKNDRVTTPYYDRPAATTPPLK